jgi:hypothetical protein
MDFGVEAQAAYLYHLGTYLFRENDRTLPVVAQRRMAQSIVDKYSVNIDTKTCSSGHSPYLSQPETLLKVVQKIVGYSV